jgi:hypothetical protein
MFRINDKERMNERAILACRQLHITFTDTHSSFSSFFLSHASNTAALVLHLPKVKRAKKIEGKERIFVVCRRTNGTVN